MIYFVIKKNQKNNIAYKKILNINFMLINNLHCKNIIYE